MAVTKIDKETQHSVAVLSANGASTNRISQHTGLHHKTVKRILEQPEIIELKVDAQTRIADKFEKLCENVLDSVSEDDLLKASLQQKSISAATMLDKCRLIRGQSLQNVSLAVMVARHVHDLEPALTDGIEIDDEAF